MLQAPTPFPEPGSYALLVEHDAALVRIHQHDRGAGTVLLSFPGRPGAGGNRTVPLAALQDGTPLTAAEQAELAGLAARVDRKRIRTETQRADKARHDSLRLRRIYAEVLRAKLRDLGLPTEIPPHAAPASARAA